MWDVLSCITVLIFGSMCVYRYTPPSLPKIDLFDASVAFLILLSCLLSAFAIGGLLRYCHMACLIHNETIIHFLFYWILASVVLCIWHWIPDTIQEKIMGKARCQDVVSIGIGLCSFIGLIAFSRIVHLFVMYMNPEATFCAQQAIVFLQKAYEQKSIFFLCTIIQITVLVPCIEEWVFRGLIQTGIASCIKSPVYIACIVATIFCCAHYSATQQASNYEILLPLFVFSCIASFVKMKQSLLASICVHMGFNIAGVIAFLVSNG